MHEIHFDRFEIEDQSVRLYGAYFQGRIQRLAGAWRVLLWHRLEDDKKGSWAVLPQDTFTVDISQQDGGLLLDGGQVLPLWLQLSPFEFRFGDLSAEGVFPERSNTLSVPEATLELATGEGNAIRETNDGLPLGAGMNLVLREPEGRQYFGLGERTGFLDKKGRIWTNWNTDSPRQTEQTDPLYQSHPFVMGYQEGRAFGLYLDETWRTVFDLGATESSRSVLHTDGPTLDLYLITGPTPKEVLRHYSGLVGTAPMPPLWALGVHQSRWSYPDQAAIRAVAREYRARGLPLEAIWMDIDYMEGYKVFTYDRGRFPRFEALTRDLKEEGIRTVVIVDPGVKKEAGYPVYESGREWGVYVENRRGEDLVGEVWPSPAVWPDFIRKEVRDWWGEWHRVYTEAGVDGIWNDMNEPSAFSVEGRAAREIGKTLPLGAKHGALWHAEAHNVYAQQMCRATFEGLHTLRPERRPFVLTRAGFAGIQRYAWVWTGDNSSLWSHLEMSVPMILNLGLSGVPFTGADIGGFSADTDGELLARWSWLGALYPFMRNHSGKGSRRQEPWAFGELVLGQVRKALEFRYRLLPYLYTLAYEASQEGLPPMRPLVLEFPEDAEAALVFDQFMLGDALLAAPVLRPHQTHRLVRLPDGAWRDWWNGEIHEGMRWLPAYAPLDGIPLFQKAGSAVPLTEPALFTTQAWWSSLDWQVALGDEIHGWVYEDDGEGYAPGFISHLRGGYDGRRLRLAFEDDAARPRERVTAIVHGITEPGHSTVPYSYQGDTLTIDLSSGAAELTW